MPDLALIRMALPDLVAQLLEDGELDDMDLALIHDAMVAQATATKEAKAATSLAHVHEEPHAPLVTLIPVEGLDEAQWPEHVDASGLVCHDCGRELVSDAGTTRVLVCPSLHGKRPQGMAPSEPDGAVECGRRAA